MKQTALILLIFLSQTGFSQENDKGKLIKKLGYTGKSTYEYSTKFGEIDSSTKFLIERNKYNSEGLTVKREYYYNGDDSNEYARIVNLQYNDKKDLIKLVNYNYKGDIENIIKYEYQDSLMKVIRIYSKEGNLTRRVNYHYNNLNKPITQLSYEASGEFSGKYTNEYNSKNQLIRENSFGKNNQLESYVLYKKNDSIDSYTQFDKNNKQTFYSLKKLNKEGIPIERESSYGDSKKFYEYNIYGLEIKTISYGENGEPESFSITEWK